MEPPPTADAAVTHREAPLAGGVSKAEGISELERRRSLALGMGRPERVEAHRSGGRMTARDRVSRLVDEGSFVELGMLAHSDRPEVHGEERI